jgi:hypothetical protein
MKILIVTALILLPFLSYSQSVLSYHQSPNGGQAAYAYEVNDKFRPEIRLFANTFIEELFLKVMLNYNFVRKDSYEFYSGLTAYTAIAEDMTIMIPFGLNIYPFEQKNFGFQMEFSPSFPFGQPWGPYFTGSWGIRYRFNRN